MARSIDLKFPSGVGRRLGLRMGSQGRREQYFAPWSLNARLEDSLTSRLRGGSFTGISAGTRPSSIVYRDRLITFSSNAITASRQGDSTDTDLDTDVSDTARPILFQAAEAGDTGDTVVAIIPHKDAYLLVFTAGATWVLSGDPATGTMRRTSDQVGIVGADAWCVAHDTVYFLSSHGLYKVSADGSGMAPISEDVLPEDLTGVSDATCTLTYQHSDRGVYIHKTGTDWFFDIAREQFWPFDTSETDSHVLFGPIKLGQTDQLGLIQEMHGIMAKSSATVNWHIVHADTAEEAAANGKMAIEADVAGNSYSGYVRESGEFAAGRSFTVRPRVTSMWCCIWLSSASDWAFEGLTLYVEPAGSWRK